MKLCKSCSTEKDRSLFGARKASLDGLSHKCKECQSDYDKSRSTAPHRVKARLDYSKTARGKEAGGRAKKRYIEKNTVKRAAHILLGNAVKSGKVSPLPCEECFNTHDLHAHHDDYAKPLDIRWLCAACHHQWHAINGQGLNG